MVFRLGIFMVRAGPSRRVVDLLRYTDNLSGFASIFALASTKSVALIVVLSENVNIHAHGRIFK